MEPSSRPFPCACEPWWSCRIRRCAWVHDSDFSLICNLNSSLYKSQIEYIFCVTSAIEVAYESGEVFANNTGLALNSGASWDLSIFIKGIAGAGINGFMIVNISG